MPKEVGSIDLKVQKKTHDEAAKTATNYISADSTGIKIASGTPETANTYQHLTSDGTEFYADGKLKTAYTNNGVSIYKNVFKNGINTAKEVGLFNSNGVKLGPSTELHTEINDSGFYTKLGNQVSIFSIETSHLDTYDVVDILYKSLNSNEQANIILEPGERGRLDYAYEYPVDPETLQSLDPYDVEIIWRYVGTDVWYRHDASSTTGLGRYQYTEEELQEGITIPATMNGPCSDHEGYWFFDSAELGKNYSDRQIQWVAAHVVKASDAVVTIGKNTQSRMRFDYHSMQMIDKSGNTYAHISDLRGEDGRYQVTETIENTSSVQRGFDLSYQPAHNSEPVTIVKVDDVVVPCETDPTTGDYVYFYFTDADAWNARRIIFNADTEYTPKSGSIIEVTYYTDSDLAKAYTFGLRKADTKIGGMSFCSGYNTESSGYVSYAEGSDAIASGDYSHAEGRNTTASGYASHAEGNYTQASGYASHAEGDHTTATASEAHAEGEHCNAKGNESHAEGSYTDALGSYSHSEGHYTTAKGYCSHTEGYGTLATGENSHAGGEGTIADVPNQTAIGRYNKETPTSGSGYYFVVGNGTGQYSRSNAFGILTTGAIEVANRQAYPTYIYTTLPANDEVPILPCIVICTSNYGVYLYT